MSTSPTLASLTDAAKARGIVLPAAQAQPVLAGATWLKGCVALLVSAGLGR